VAFFPWKEPSETMVMGTVTLFPLLIASLYHLSVGEARIFFKHS